MRAILFFLLVLLQTAAHASSLSDISSIRNVVDKKVAFFNAVYPSVIKANKEILLERQFIQQCNQECMDTSEKFQRILSKYRIKSVNVSQQRTELLEKVDIIPVNLALNQAANESNWGGSRFSKMANNLFGVWCFSSGCGIVPKARPDGEVYEVRKYSNIDQSVAHYMLTLNTHISYKSLRDLRREHRINGLSLDAENIAEGLLMYSQRRNDYIHEIQSMIRVNKKFITKIESKRNLTEG